jgi:hypothetical protein
VTAECGPFAYLYGYTCPYPLPLDNTSLFPHAGFSRGCGARGDLGQLAPRKKLLKSCRVSQSFSETLLALFGTEGFLFSCSALPSRLVRSFDRVFMAAGLQSGLNLRGSYA